MKKEVLIAIIFGLIVGLIITVGMYRARRSLETTPQEEAPITTTIDATPQATISPSVQSDKLKIREPDDELFTMERTLRISGTTVPSSSIIILHNEEEVIGTSDDQGNFSIPITLTAGANVCVIRVLPDNEAPIEVTRTIVYDGGTEPTATASAQSTTSAKASPTPKATATPKKASPKPSSLP